MKLTKEEYREVIKERRDISKIKEEMLEYKEIKAWCDCPHVDPSNRSEPRIRRLVDATEEDTCPYCGYHVFWGSKELINKINMNDL